MKLTKQRQKDTGAFYTPKQWADLAVAYMREYLPLPLEYYTFYDPAGGEGALMEALPQNCIKYATTLEKEDVEIMRSKGIKAWQFDFLNDDTEELPHALYNASRCNRLVIFMNPPYVKLPAEPKTYAGEIYGTNDSVELFYYRAVFDLDPVFICSFNKMDILQAVKMQGFRQIFTTGRPLLKLFISKSSSWGLKGKFPIGFMMWSCKMSEEQYTEEMEQKMERWQGLYAMNSNRYLNPAEYKPPKGITEKIPTSDDIAMGKAKPQELVNVKL